MEEICQLFFPGSCLLHIKPCRWMNTICLSSAVSTCIWSCWGLDWPAARMCSCRRSSRTHCPSSQRRSRECTAGGLYIPSQTLHLFLWARGCPARVHHCLSCWDWRGLLSSRAWSGSAAPSLPEVAFGAELCSLLLEPEQCQLHPLQNLQAVRKGREQAVKKPENVCKIYVSFLTLKVFQQSIYGMRNFFCHWRNITCREVG